MKTSHWSTKLAGLSAIALISVAGCTGKDTTGDGQAADSPGAAKMANAGQQVANGVGQAADTAGDVAGNAVDGAGQAVANGVDAAGNAVDGAGQAVANGVDAAGNTLSGAGRAVANGVSNAGVAVKNAGSAAVNTPTIKSALAASKAMDGSNINVDSTATTVTLSGTVKSAMQKNMAGSIAKSKAGGLKIVNNLVVKK